MPFKQVRLAFFICLSLGLSGIATAQDDYLNRLQMRGFQLFETPGDTPEIQLQSDDPLFDENTQVLIVNFWAKWCGPCVHELPTLNALQKSFEGKPVQVIAVSHDFGTFDQSRKFLSAKGGPNLALRMDDKGKTLRNFGGVGLPFTVIIDRDGLWHATLEGPENWSDTALVQDLHTLVNTIIEKRY